MGQQHNSHVANETDEAIKVVLTDRDNRNTTQVINSREYCCIPTSKGKVTLSAFRKGPDGQFESKANASYTNDSDRSFLVKKNNGHLNIHRVKYNSIWTTEDSLQ